MLQSAAANPVDGTDANRLVAERLRRLRKAHGISLRQFAEATGTSASLLSQMERGLSGASTLTLIPHRQLPWLLGGPSSTMLSTLVQQLVLSLLNWDRGGAMGVASWSRPLASWPLPHPLCCANPKLAGVADEAPEPAQTAVGSDLALDRCGWWRRR